MSNVSMISQFYRKLKKYKEDVTIVKNQDKCQQSRMHVTNLKNVTNLENVEKYPKSAKNVWVIAYQQRQKFYSNHRL